MALGVQWVGQDVGQDLADCLQVAEVVLRLALLVKAYLEMQQDLAANILR